MILLKTLDSEIVHLMQDPENHARVSRTYSLRPIKGVPPDELNLLAGLGYSSEIIVSNYAQIEGTYVLLFSSS